LKAIIAQIEYLLAVETGNTRDFTKLKTIIIGRMTAQDIDSLDPQLAEILYLVAAEVRTMIAEYDPEIYE
jgi:hypothetical protein